MTIEWVGGGQTQARVVRPVAQLEQLNYYPQLCARAQRLAAEGLTMAALAARLNAEGYRPPKRRAHFGAQGIQNLRERHRSPTLQESLHRTTGHAPIRRA